MDYFKYSPHGMYDEPFAELRANGKPRCCTGVPNNPGMGFHQCDNTGVEQTDLGWFCKVHGPSAVKAKADRQAAARKAEDDKWAERAAKREREIAKNLEFEAALEMIANGHNDPRSLAASVLEKFRS